MSREVSRYICQKCGWESPKWQGQCQECGQWNSLVETVVSTKRSKIKDQRSKTSSIKAIKLSEVKSKAFSRIKTGIGELDRVLGGGIVPGSVVLIAGEPGIGKSTLLTQLALRLIKTSTSNSVLYVCGEESPQQIKIRVNRILTANPKSQYRNPKLDNLFFLPETNVENILLNLQPTTYNLQLVIIDSIQTLWTEKLTGMAGSVGQIRESSNMLLEVAKRSNIPVFLIGHITKEGAIAGPKVLEHLVDTVLYLQGDKQHEFRILRGNKNRFGPTDEVGVFIMRDSGMEEVKNPADLFLESRIQNPESRIGSTVVAVMQGIRPMLVEIQALVIPSQLAMPRRVASGIDYRRLQVLCAVLQKHCRIPLSSSDVFVNVAGGLALSEPAADLGICLSIASSFKNKALPEKSVAIGEVGLLGEIRKVSFLEKRIKEARKLGYRWVIGEKERSLREAIKRYLKA